MKCKNCGKELDPGKAVDRLLICENCSTPIILYKETTTAEARELIARGNRMLDTGNFGEAYQYFKRAAKLSATESEAYWGMALAEFRVRYRKDVLRNRLQPVVRGAVMDKFQENLNYQKAMLFATLKTRKEYHRLAVEIDAAVKASGGGIAKPVPASAAFSKATGFAETNAPASAAKPAPMPAEFVEEQSINVKFAEETEAFEETVEEVAETPVEEMPEEVAEVPYEEENAMPEPVSEVYEEPEEAEKETEQPVEELPAEQPIYQESEIHAEEIAQEPAEERYETPAEEPAAEVPYGEESATSEPVEEIYEEPVQEFPAEEVAEETEVPAEEYETPVAEEYGEPAAEVYEEIAEQPVAEVPYEEESEIPAEPAAEVPYGEPVGEAAEAQEEPAEEFPAEEVAEEVEVPAEEYETPAAEEYEEPAEESAEEIPYEEESEIPVGPVEEVPAFGEAEDETDEEERVDAFPAGAKIEEVSAEEMASVQMNVAPPTGQPMYGVPPMGAPMPPPMAPPMAPPMGAPMGAPMSPPMAPPMGAPMGAPAQGFAPNEPAKEFEIVNGEIVKYTGTGATVIIPVSVTSIKASAFEGNKFISRVIIPNSVTKIGARAFANCHSLRVVMIPESVAEMEKDVFIQCNEILVLNCAAAKEPKTWDKNWNKRNDGIFGGRFKAIWGYKG